MTARTIRLLCMTALSVVLATTAWANLSGTTNVPCPDGSTPAVGWTCPDDCPWNCNTDNSGVSCTCTTAQGITICEAFGSIGVCPPLAN